MADKTTMEQVDTTIKVDGNWCICWYHFSTFLHRGIYSWVFSKKYSNKNLICAALFK